jgi:hypothetical protein
VPNGASKRRAGKTQARNAKKAREARLLSFGQDEISRMLCVKEFDAKKKAAESRTVDGPVPEAQDEEQQHQSLNLDIRTSDRNLGRNAYDMNDQQNTSPTEDEGEALVQD